MQQNPGSNYSYDQAVESTSDLPGFTVKKLSGSRAGNVTWTFNEDTGTLLLTSGNAEFGETFTESPFRDLNVRRAEFSDSFACKSIPANLFAGCTSLTEVHLAAQTTEIGEAAFKDCTNLRRVTWHDGIKTISESAFENCTNLKHTPAKAGKTTLTIYAEADEVFNQSEPIRITITVKARPAKVTAKVKKLTKKKARVSWKKINGVKSYQIQVSLKKNFKKKKTYTAKSSATKKVVKITKGKKNYVRVRYKLANGKAGKWSTTLVVKK